MSSSRMVEGRECSGGGPHSFTSCSLCWRSTVVMNFMETCSRCGTKLKNSKGQKGAGKSPLRESMQTIETIKIKHIVIKKIKRYQRFICYNIL